MFRKGGIGVRSNSKKQVNRDRSQSPNRSRGRQPGGRQQQHQRQGNARGRGGGGRGEGRGRGAWRNAGRGGMSSRPTNMRPRGTSKLGPASSLFRVTTHTYFIYITVLLLCGTYRTCPRLPISDSPSGISWSDVPKPLR